MRGGQRRPRVMVLIAGIALLAVLLAVFYPRAEGSYIIANGRYYVTVSKGQFRAFGREFDDFDEFVAYYGLTVMEAEEESAVHYGDRNE